MAVGSPQRYSRQTVLPGIGESGQKRLSDASVLIVGAGGLGSPVGLYLAAAGVGRIGIVDDDVLEVSNLQRQVLYSEADVGSPKAEAAATRLRELNSESEIIALRTRLMPSNALEIFGGYDVVIDATDNYATRYLVSDACAILGKPHIWGSVFQMEGQVSVWWPARRGPCYRCVFPSNEGATLVPSCAEAGVLGAVCGSIGAAQATAALGLILGFGDDSVGVLRTLDATTGRWEDLSPRRRPECPACGPHGFTTLFDAPEYAGDACAAPRNDVVASITPAELADLLVSSPEGLVIIDVREVSERADGRIEGDESFPLRQFLDGAAEARLDAAADIVLYCRSGMRSARAWRSLPSDVQSRARNLEGGMLAWQGSQNAVDLASAL
jgi:adenylyltransferase/sulfurtransferase